MNAASPAHRRSTAILMIAVPLLFMAFFTLLQIRFDYPDILRRPAAEVLTRFAADAPRLGWLWYGMFASALAFIAMAASIPAHLPGTPRRGLLVAGVLAGLVQAIGLARWVFAVPVLCQHYQAATDPASRQAVVVAFDTLNHFLGAAVGEHMGYLFTGVWTLLLAGALRTGRPILAAIGAILATGILAGMLEPSGIADWAGPVNAIAYSLWSLWLVWAGVLLLAGRLPAPPPAA